SLNIFSNDLVDYTNRNLIIMRGTADTLRDSNLNTDPLSDAQGRNRFERAAYFFNKGVQINSSLIWKLIDVPNVGHDYKNMAISAGDFLLHGVTSVERLDNEIPERINIYNYPNPFNPTTVIGYRLPVAGHVTLRVFDLLGREIVTLVNEEKQAGKYEVKLDGNGLASGIYFYQLITNKTTETMKMILQK
ncbi:MAG: T9SS type A sorting domain-containing protein, partial [Melioribacteraceae bacterium]